MVGVHSLSWGFRAEETGQYSIAKHLLRLQLIEACQDRTPGLGLRWCNGAVNASHITVP